MLLSPLYWLAYGRYNQVWHLESHAHWVNGRESRADDPELGVHLWIHSQIYSHAWPSTTAMYDVSSVIIQLQMIRRFRNVETVDGRTHYTLRGPVYCTVGVDGGRIMNLYRGEYSSQLQLGVLLNRCRLPFFTSQEFLLLEH